jgi:signal transduction histidine kinase
MQRAAGPRTATLWLQLLLVGGLASVAIIIVQSYRAARSSQVVAERALRDYSAFAAWSYREHLVGALRSAMDELLGPVNHGDGLHTSPRVPSAADLGHYLRWNEACWCHEPQHGPMPLRYYAFVLGSDTLGVGVNRNPTGRRGWLVDPPDGKALVVNVSPLPAEDARWVRERLTVVTRKTPRSPWGYHLVVEPFGDVVRLLASRPMATQWGDTLVYAIEYSPAAADSLFRGVFSLNDLLPPSLVRGRENADVIDLEVSDLHRRPVFRSRAADGWELAEVNMLPMSYGGLHVKAQVRPALAEALLIGGTPGSRVPFLLVLLVLALGLSAVAAVQLRRDVRFATDRASFVASVSHELRTPLAQVRLVLDTIRLGRDTDAAMRQAALDLADREVLRLQHLVEGLLRFTRGGRPDDTPRMRVDVAQEARSAALEFQPLATPRGITITVTGSASAQATLQRGALRQVLLNLLDNAVKYGRDDAPVTVDVSVPAGQGARIAVTDSGPGVPAAERERIWRPFERGTQARARAAGGSGIGLTIVRDIARDHGARAWVEDAPGGGARFVVQFPPETGPA